MQLDTFPEKLKHFKEYLDLLDVSGLVNFLYVVDCGVHGSYGWEGCTFKEAYSGTDEKPVFLNESLRESFLAISLSFTEWTSLLLWLSNSLYTKHTIESLKDELKRIKSQ